MVMVLFKKIKSFLDRLFEELPNNGALHKRGYQTLMFNGDLFLRKKIGRFTISLYQSIEPHHPVYKYVVDFDIDYACVVIENGEEDISSHSTFLEIRELFDYSFERDRFLFSMDKKMDFNDPKHLTRLLQIEEILKSAQDLS